MLRASLVVLALVACVFLAELTEVCMYELLPVVCLLKGLPVYIYIYSYQPNWLWVVRYAAESITTDAGRFSCVGLYQLRTKQFCMQLTKAYMALLRTVSSPDINNVAVSLYDIIYIHSCLLMPILVCLQGMHCQHCVRCPLLLGTWWMHALKSIYYNIRFPSSIIASTACGGSLWSFQKCTMQESLQVSPLSLLLYCQNGNA